MPLKTLDIINEYGDPLTVKKLSVKKYDEETYVEYTVIGANTEWIDCTPIKAFLKLNPDFVNEVLSKV